MAETLRINFVTGAAHRHIAELEALAAVPDRVQAAVAGQAGVWWRQAPASGTVPEGAAGEWSPGRVVGHLIAYARQSHENLDRMAWMTDPIIKSTDDAAAAEMYAWELQEPAQLLDWLTAAVSESVELLKELPDASWGRPGQHPESGRRSIRQQVVVMGAHFSEHIAQIERARG